MVIALQFLSILVVCYYFFVELSSCTMFRTIFLLIFSIKTNIHRSLYQRIYKKNVLINIIYIFTNKILINNFCKYNYNINML